MALTQDNREIAIQTQLGKDALLLQRVTGSEKLGQMFKFELELFSKNFNIKFADIVGQNVTIRLNLDKGGVRYFNGYISRFVQTESHGDLARYQATVVPWLWFLTRTADCRIFQGKTVPEIIKEVFREHGFTDIKDTLTEKYRTWDYCVQYRETDYNFVNRLMEQEGIYYFFVHEDQKHTIVLADSINAHESYPGYDQIRYRPTSGALSTAEYIWEWLVESNIQPGMYKMNDFDYRNVKADILAVAKDPEADSQKVAGRAVSELEIFDYPGEYIDEKTKSAKDDGERYARIRSEELQAQKLVCHARSDARGIAAGYLFELADHRRSDQNCQYLITSVNYLMTTDPYESESRQKESEPVFACEFAAISSDQPYRPTRVTPQPMIRGPQTATVVGPKDEKISTDKYGRVKVQFHWDRYGKVDQNSSCWVRVSQLWAGHNWGGMHIPHIGQEVIVEFLEGDPDQPIITGRVYNIDNMPPKDLPENKHKSIIRDNAGNALIFDAQPGKENITLLFPQSNSGSADKSGITWGQQGCLWYGSRNAGEVLVGAKAEVLGGTKTETVVGSSSEALVGFNSEFKLASSIEAILGPSVSVRKGQNYEICYRDSVNTAENDWLQLVHGDAILDSKGERGQKLILCAGPKRESVVEMGANEIKLKVGEAADRKDEFDTEPLERLIKAMAITAGVAHALDAAGTIIDYSVLSGKKLATQKEDEYAEWHDWAQLFWSIPTHAVTIVAHLITIIAAKKLHGNQQKPDNVKKEIRAQKPNAEIEMLQDGGIIIDSKTGKSVIEMTTNGDIIIKGGKNIKLQSPSLKADGTLSVNNGNLTVAK